MMILMDLIMSVVIAIVRVVFGILIAVVNGISGLDGEDTLDKFFEMIPSGTEVYKIFAIIGLFLAGMILLYSLGVMFFVREKNSNDVLGLMGRMLLVYVLIFYFPEIMKWVFKIPTVMYDAIETTTNAGAGEGLGDDIFGVMKKIGAEVLVGVTGLGALSGFAGVLKSIIMAVLLFGLCSSMFNLSVEMIERYVVLGLLVITSGPAISTLVSRDTEKIFKGWVGSLMSTLVLMVLNALFLSMLLNGLGVLAVANVTSFTGGISQVLILMTISRLGTKADEMLRTIGLTTIQTGRGLGPEMFMAANTASRLGVPAALSGMQGFATNNKMKPAQSFGEVMKAAGMAASQENIATDTASGDFRKGVMATDKQREGAKEDIAKKMDKNDPKAMSSDAFHKALDSKKNYNGREVGAAINSALGGNIAKNKNITDGTIGKNGALSLSEKNKNGETTHHSFIPFDGSKSDIGDKNIVEDDQGNKYIHAMSGDGALSSFTDTEAPSEGEEYGDFAELAGEAAVVEDMEAEIMETDANGAVEGLEEGDVLASDLGGSLEVGAGTLDESGHLQEYDADGNIAEGGGFFKDADGSLVAKDSIMSEDGRNQVTKTSGEVGDAFEGADGQTHQLYNSGEVQSRVNNETGETEIAARDAEGNKYWASAAEGVVGEDGSFRSQTSGIMLAGVDGEGVQSSYVPTGENLRPDDLDTGTILGTKDGGGAMLTNDSFETGTNIPQAYSLNEAGEMKPHDFSRDYESYKARHAERSKEAAESGFKTRPLMSYGEFKSSMVASSGLDGGPNYYMKGTDPVTGEEKYFRPSVSKGEVGSGPLGEKERLYGQVKPTFSVGGIPTDSNGMLSFSAIESYAAGDTSVDFKLKDGTAFTSYPIDLNNFDITDQQANRNSTMTLGNSGRQFYSSVERTNLFSNLVPEGESAYTMTAIPNTDDQGLVDHYNKVEGKYGHLGPVDRTVSGFEMFKSSMAIDAPAHVFDSIESVSIQDGGSFATVRTTHPEIIQVQESHDRMLQEAADMYGVTVPQLIELSTVEHELDHPKYGKGLSWATKQNYLEEEYRPTKRVPRGVYSPVPDWDQIGFHPEDQQSQFAEWKIIPASDYSVGDSAEAYKGTAYGQDVIMVRTKDLSGRDTSNIRRNSSGVKVEPQKGVSLSESFKSNLGSHRKR